MHRIKVSIITVAIIASPMTSLAQTTVPGPQFCGTAFDFKVSETDGVAALKKCQRGDTVLITASSVGVVARFCDFNKAIVSTGGYVVCVLQTPERTTRKTN